MVDRQTKFSPLIKQTSARPGRRGSRKGTYKGRLNLHDEMRLKGTHSCMSFAIPMLDMPVAP